MKKYQMKKKPVTILATTMLLAITLLVASCGTQKKATKETGKANSTEDVVWQQSFMDKMQENTSSESFITSKIKFTVEVGALRQSLTGNLRMKRDDVIRLQLMAFGFVEAGRLEFTKDYVLFVDRINKQYFQMPYEYVSFLRNSGINFYTLQALFWNELFLPGHTSVTAADQSQFTTQREDETVTISYEKDNMSYNWFANAGDGRLQMANILHQSKTKGNTQLNWDYRKFERMGKKYFPSDMFIKLTTTSKEINLGLTLNYLGNESDWETRTQVSSKYSKVELDEMLSRFMSL
jgi:hypothetical protein